MKKFLVLFLLVSLVPFTVGCRLFDKGDDDVAAAPAPVAKFKLPIVVPSVFAPSIRASLDMTYKIGQLRLVIEGISMVADPNSTPETLPNNGGLRIVFISEEKVLESTIDSIKEKGDIDDIEAELKYIAPDDSDVVAVIDTVTFKKGDLKTVVVKTEREDTTKDEEFTTTALDSAPKSPKDEATLEQDIVVELKKEAKAKKGKDIDYKHVSYSVVDVTYDDQIGGGVASVATSVASASERPVFADTEGKIAITVKTNREYSNPATPTFKIEVSNNNNPDGFVTVDTSKEQTFVTVDATDKDAPKFTFNRDAEYKKDRKLTSGETYKIKFVSTTAYYQSEDIGLTIPDVYYIMIH